MTQLRSDPKLRAEHVHVGWTDNRLTFVIMQGKDIVVLDPKQASHLREALA